MNQSKETMLETNEIQNKIYQEAELFEMTIQAYQKEVETGIHEIITSIENILIEKFPNASLQAYGSFVTGLYMHFSDVDLVISFPSLDHSAFSLDTGIVLEILAEAIVLLLTHHFLSFDKETLQRNVLRNQIGSSCQVPFDQVVLH